MDQGSVSIFTRLSLPKIFQSYMQDDNARVQYCVNGRCINAIIYANKTRTRFLHKHTFCRQTDQK